MPDAPPTDSRLRIRFAFAAILCIPLGLATKRSGLFPVDWLANSIGGALYVLLGVMAAGAIAPRTVAGTRRRRALAVVTVSSLTALVEFSQLWHLDLLESIRSTLGGRLVLGTTFAWSDFPGYLVGAIVAWWSLGLLAGNGSAVPRSTEYPRTTDSKSE